MLKYSLLSIIAVFPLTRMFKEWNRVFPESWRNIWRRSVWASSPTINLNGVQYLHVDFYHATCTNSHSQSLPYLNVLLCWNEDQGVVVWFPLEGESEGLKSSKLFHLSAQLDKEKKRAESLKETCRENSVLLQRQTQLYLSVSTLSKTCR